MHNKTWLIIRRTDSMLRLDFIWNWLVTNGRVQRPWTDTGYIFIKLRMRRIPLSFGWSKNFRDRRRCCPQLYDPSTWMCVCVVYPYAVLDVQRCVPEESIVLQDTGLFGIILEGRRAAALKDPDAMFAAHATDQTKGLVKDKWMFCEEWLTK